MANMKLLLMLPVLLSILASLILPSSSAHVPPSLHAAPRVKPGCFAAVFAFGDSLTDTGNAIKTPNPVYQIANHLPYGETFFHRPTGRCSDGRLVVDFLCQAVNSSLLQPYLNHGNRQFARGYNFAVAGTTALNTTFLLHKTNVTSFTPLSLEDEIHWFKISKAAAVHAAGFVRVKKFVQESLFYFGEIGGNDLNYWFAANKTIEEVKVYVPLIMEQIQHALQELIDEGARNIIVQGNFPIGCSPLYLQTKPGKPKDYDKHGCLKSYNQLSRHSNSKLKGVLASLKSKNPYVKMVYFDAEGAGLEILKNPHKYGITNTTGICFNIASLLNPSNSNIKDILKVKACSDPSKYANWDGIHPTEALSKALAHLFMTGECSRPRHSFLSRRCKLSLTV